MEEVAHLFEPRHVRRVRCECDGMMADGVQGSYTFSPRLSSTPSQNIFEQPRGYFTLRQLQMVVRGNHLENLNFKTQESCNATSV